MKKIWAAFVTAALLTSCVSACYAAEDGVETVTNAMKKFQAEVSFKSQNVDETFREAFDKNPELFYYFGGYDGTATNGKKNQLQITYVNTDVDPDSVFVVSSTTDLYNVIGLALVDTMEQVPIVITDSAITTEDIVDTIDQWRTDHYLAYMGFDNAYATMKSADISAWTACTLTLSYVESPETVQEWRTETQEKVIALCGSLFALDMPDYQKELLIHDYIIEHCTYRESSDSKAQYTAYGCLVQGEAVCEGYAESARLLFQAAGLESYYVEGAGTSANHAWNCVQIDGQFYWVDLTWDDPVPEVGEAETLDHKYFNLTDSQLNEDHSWQYAKYPSCVSTTWNYSAVKAALNPGEGTETAPVAYTDYSAKNVTKLEDLRGDLIYALGVDEEKLAAATPQTTAGVDGTADPAQAEGSDGTAAPEGASQEKESSHTGLKVFAGVVIVLALLVVAYLIYRRIMYLRYLERKRARQRAKKSAARQNGGGSGTAQRRTPAGAGAGSGRSGSGQGSGSSDRPRRENPFR